MSDARGRFLAVVPARGGSKRIPRKNIRPFRGVPLLTRTIATMIRADVFDSIIVSTDDAEIAQVALDAGASVPFMRPNELSDDWTPTAPVVAHAIGATEDDLGALDAVCCVYPGAVLMTASDYSASRKLVDEAIHCGSVVAAVVRYSHPIERALRRGAGGLLEPAGGLSALRQRTQDIEPAWHDAGQFYWASPSRWRTPAPLLSSVVPYELPEWRVRDIDTEDDWFHAEFLHLLINGQAPRTAR
jgi:pseudaminic acid cytidylyltransferase